MSKELQKQIKRLVKDNEQLRADLKAQRRESQSNEFNFYLRSIAPLNPAGERTFRVGFEVRDMDLIHLAPVVRLRMRQMTDMLWAELKAQGIVKGDAPDIFDETELREKLRRAEANARGFLQ